MGCVDKSLRKKLLGIKNLKLEKLVEKAVSTETVDNQANVIEQNGDTGEVCSLGDTGDQDLCALYGKSSGLCFGCGEPGHVIHHPSCPASLLNCKKCGYIGHFAKCCLKKENKGTPIFFIRN